MDAVSRKEFWEMLKSLQGKGITIIVSTPYMDEASLCDRVALAQQGSMLTIDSPENIINKYPKHLWAIRTADMYRLKEDLTSFSDCGSVHVFGQYLHFTRHSDIKTTDDIRNYLEKGNHSSIEIRKIEAGIEDCFIANMSENRAT